AEIHVSVRTRESGPSKRKSWVELHRPLVKAHGLLKIVCSGRSARFKSQPTEIRVVSLWIVCRLNRQGSLLAASQLGLQRVSDRFGDLALDAEDVDELAIKGVGPQMRFAGRLDELNVDTHLIGGFLDAPLQDVGHAKLLRDLGEIAWLALITL